MLSYRSHLFGVYKPPSVNVLRSVDCLVAEACKSSLPYVSIPSLNGGMGLTYEQNWHMRRHKSNQAQHPQRPLRLYLGNLLTLPLDRHRNHPLHRLRFHSRPKTDLRDLHGQAPSHATIEPEKPHPHNEFWQTEPCATVVRATPWRFWG